MFLCSAQVFLFLAAAAAAKRGPYLSHQHHEGKGFCLFVHCCFLSTYDLESLDESQVVCSQAWAAPISLLLHRPPAPVVCVLLAKVPKGNSQDKGERPCPSGSPWASGWAEKNNKDLTNAGNTVGGIKGQSATQGHHHTKHLAVFCCFSEWQGEWMLRFSFYTRRK